MLLVTPGLFVYPDPVYNRPGMMIRFMRILYRLLHFIQAGGFTYLPVH